ncbi:MAG: hypothetical protein ACR2OI_10535 [Acidimicrobiia bacterium]
MPRRSTEDKVTQTGGVLRAVDAPRPEPPGSTWNPFQELEEQILEPAFVYYELPIDHDEIPDGLEGRYFF